jgi:hypothetical protein
LLPAVGERETKQREEEKAMTVNDVTIFAMGTMAALSMIATIGIFWTGIFALLAGRDTVWECSWQWPGKLMARLHAAGETPMIAAMRVAFVRFITNEPRRQTDRRQAPHQPQPAARRPAAEHYLTVGARARMRSQGYAPRSSRRAA